MAAAALVLGLAGTVVTAAPASADVQVYQNINYGGGYRSLGTTQVSYHFRYYDNGVQLWDSVTSLRNNYGHWTTFWTEPACGGDGFSVEPWGTRSYVGATFNDRFSAHAPESVGSGC